MLSFARTAQKNDQPVGNSGRVFRDVASQLSNELVQSLTEEHSREVNYMFQEIMTLRGELERVLELLTGQMAREKQLHGMLEGLNSVYEQHTRHLHDTQAHLVEHSKKTQQSTDAQRKGLVDPLRDTELELQRIQNLLAQPVVGRPDVQPHLGGRYGQEAPGADRRLQPTTPREFRIPAVTTPRPAFDMAPPAQLQYPMTSPRSPAPIYRLAGAQGFGGSLPSGMSTPPLPAPPLRTVPMVNPQPWVQPPAALQNMFDALDRNHDGVIDRNEFNMAQVNPAVAMPPPALWRPPPMQIGFVPGPPLSPGVRFA